MSVTGFTRLAATTAALAALLGGAAGCSAAAGPPTHLDGPSPARVTPPSASSASSVMALPPPPPQPAVDHHPAQEPLLELPPLAHEQLPSGLEVTLVAGARSPVSTVDLVVAAGGLADRPGVAELTAGLVAQGAASKHLRVRTFAEAVAMLGADLEVEVHAGQTRFRLTVPHDQLVPAIATLGDMVEQRHLRATTYRNLRALALSAARAWAGDDPRRIGRELLQRSLLGGGAATSRRANRGTYSELTRVRHDHCNQFYAAQYRGDRTRLLVVGPASLTEVVAAAKKAFGKYPKPAAGSAGQAGPPPELKGRFIYLVDHPDAPRSTITFGWVTPVITPATLPALEVLAASLQVALRRPPSPGQQPAEGLSPPEVTLGALTNGRYLLTVTATADRATTGERGAALTTALSAFVETAVSTEQVTVLRRQLHTRLALAIEQPGALAHRLGELHHLGSQAPDWLGYPTRLAALSAQAVDPLRISLSPPPVMVVVGHAEQIGPQLAGLGEVVVVNPLAGFGTLETLPASKR